MAISIGLCPSVLLFLLPVFLAMPLEEYAEYQRQNPQILLDNVEIDPLNQSSQQPFSKSHHSLEKLIFVTPWNKAGQDLVLKYARKLSYVSPCWYQFRINTQSEPVFENELNYNWEFARRLKHNNKDIKIVPRVYLSGGQSNFFMNIGSNAGKFTRAIDHIVRIVTSHKFDGIVWDTPYNLFEHSRQNVNKLISQFLQALRRPLGPSKIVLFNMANPSGQTLQLQLYRSLAVDGILVQNYDTGRDYADMLKDSISWVQSLNRHDIKYFLLLQFFANKLGEGAINAEDASIRLNKNGVAFAQVENGSCSFYEHKTKAQYWIPCYAYFETAFAMISRAKHAVGFWEAGNGLQKYFQFM